MRFRSSLNSIYWIFIENLNIEEIEFERGYFRPPGRGGKIHKNALNFFFSCRTAMRQRASERSTLQHSQTIFFVVIGCFLTLLSWFKVTRFVKNDVSFFLKKLSTSELITHSNFNH